jgi:hypothetical protein
VNKGLESVQSGFAALRDAVVRGAVHDVGTDRLRVEARSGLENRAPNWQTWVRAGCWGKTPATRCGVPTGTPRSTTTAIPASLTGRASTSAGLEHRADRAALPARAGVKAKLHLNVNYGVHQRSRPALSSPRPAEYAGCARTYLHLREKYGLVPDSWEVLLEPDGVPGYDGALLGRMIVAAGARLREHGFTPQFVAPSTKRMDNALTWFDAMAAVPGALADVAEYSYHRYGGMSVASLRGIAERATRHQLPTAMLEWWFGNATHYVLNQDLTVGRNSAWQGRTLGSLFDLQRWKPGSTLVLNRDVRYNRHYFRYVRRGAVRIGATAHSPDVRPVSFINTDGRYVVVAIAGRAAELQVVGLPAGRYGVWYSTDRQEVELPPVSVPAGGALNAAIPAAGVITFWALPPDR